MNKGGRLHQLNTMGGADKASEPSTLIILPPYLLRP